LVTWKRKNDDVIIGKKDDVIMGPNDDVIEGSFKKYVLKWGVWGGGGVLIITQNVKRYGELRL
jgi:hypothetical protein